MKRISWIFALLGALWLTDAAYAQQMLPTVVTSCGAQSLTTGSPFHTFMDATGNLCTNATGGGGGGNVTIIGPLGTQTIAASVAVTPATSSLWTLGQGGSAISAGNPLFVSPGTGATWAQGAPAVSGPWIVNQIDASATGTIAALNGAVTLSLSGQASAYALISGTWVGSIQFQGTVNGTTWVPLNAVAGGLGNAYSTTAFTANSGIRIALPAAFTQIRAYSTAWTSGTATVIINASAAPANVEAIQLNAANLHATAAVDQTTPGTSNLVAASQSGTWTVQPGNTANSIPWLTSISQGGNTAAVKPASTAPATTDPALVVAVSPNSGIQGYGNGGTVSGSNGLLTGGQYSTTPLAPSNGQFDPFSLNPNGGLQVSNNVSSQTGTTASATITNSSTAIVAAANRTFLSIDNESTTATIACNFGGTAAINTAGSFTIPPGSTRTWATWPVPADSVNCISSAATSPATIEKY